jgi:hypothetical protein
MATRKSRSVLRREAAQLGRKAPAFVAGACVCGHIKADHVDRAGVLACTAPGCACGPGCIHDGFVAADGTMMPDEALRFVARTAELVSPKPAG